VSLLVFPMNTRSIIAFICFPVKYMYLVTLCLLNIFFLSPTILQQTYHYPTFHLRSSMYHIPSLRSRHPPDHSPVVAAQPSKNYAATYPLIPSPTTGSRFHPKHTRGRPKPTCRGPKSCRGRIHRVGRLFISKHTTTPASCRSYLCTIQLSYYAYVVNMVFFYLLSV
jgi:hypothetical protein